MKEKIKFNDFFIKITKFTPIKNQAQLAKELGVGRAAISIAKQKDSIPIKWVFDLCSRYGLSPLYLMTGEGEPYIDKVKGQETTFIEPIVELEEEHDSKQTLNIKLISKDYKISSTGYFYVQMQEKAMEPYISCGDFLLIEKIKKLSLGDIGVFKIPFKQEINIVVRRLSIGENGLILVPDNAKYPTLSYRDESIETIGKVIGFYRKI